jgi:hypothetical protein
MYLVATGEPPFRDKPFDQGLVCDILGGLRPTMPDSAPDGYKKLADVVVMLIQTSVQKMERKLIMKLRISLKWQERINLIIISGILSITMISNPYPV